MIARSGDEVGRRRRPDRAASGGTSYPPVTGAVVGVGGRAVFVSAGQIQEFAPDRIVLSRNKVDLRSFERREGEVLLRADILGHRLIDVAAAELVHAYDVELDNTARAGCSHAWIPAGPPGSSDSSSPAAVASGLEGVRAADRAHPVDDRARGVGPGGRLKPAQIADLLEDANKDERGEILDQVHGDPELEADVFEELDPDKASRLLDDMSDTEVAALLGRMRADDAADAMIDLRQSRRRRVLDLMPAGQRTKVITLMGFNPDSAGGLMNVDFASCAPQATVAQALSVIAEARALQSEALLKMHVLDEETACRCGLGDRVAAGRPQARVGELMDADPVRVAPMSMSPISRC